MGSINNMYGDLFKTGVDPNVNPKDVGLFDSIDKMYNDIMQPSEEEKLKRELEIEAYRKKKE
jgi:hypothetical protein